MASSKTEVVNMAFAILGKSAGEEFDYIEDIEDSEDKAAQWASRIFDRCIRRAMVILKPPECIRYAASGATKATPVNTFPDEYEYVYARHAECIGMLDVILTALDAKGREQSTRYLEASDEIAVITSDDVLFKYLIYEADTTKWCEGLADVGAHLVAYYLCGPMRASDEARITIKTLLRDAITTAKEDIGQGRHDPLRNSAERIDEID